MTCFKAVDCSLENLLTCMRYLVWIGWEQYRWLQYGCLRLMSIGLILLSASCIAQANLMLLPPQEQVILMKPLVERYCGYSPSHQLGIALVDSFEFERLVIHIDHEMVASDKVFIQSRLFREGRFQNRQLSMNIGSGLPNYILNNDSIIVLRTSPLYTLLTIFNALCKMAYVQNNLCPSQTSMNSKWAYLSSIHTDAAALLATSQFLRSCTITMLPMTSEENTYYPLSRTAVSNYYEDVLASLNIQQNILQCDSSATVKKSLKAMLDFPQESNIYKRFFQCTHMMDDRAVRYDLRWRPTPGMTITQMPELAERWSHLLEKTPDIESETDAWIKLGDRDYYAVAFNCEVSYDNSTTIEKRSEELSSLLKQAFPDCITRRTAYGTLFLMYDTTKVSQRVAIADANLLARSLEKVHVSSSICYCWRELSSNDSITSAYDRESVPSIIVQEAVSGVQERFAAAFYGPDPDANGIREYAFLHTRAFLTGLNRSMVWTSGHRDNSENHRNGAFDYRSNGGLSTEYRHWEAEQLSKELGSHFMVIVEEAMFATRGEPTLLLGGPTMARTSYRNGSLIAVHFDPWYQTDKPVTHTHVQLAPGIAKADAIASLGITPVAGSLQRLQVVTARPPSTQAKNSSTLFDLQINFPVISSQSVAIAIIQAVAVGKGLEYRLSDGTYQGAMNYGLGGVVRANRSGWNLSISVGGHSFSLPATTPVYRPTGISFPF